MPQPADQRIAQIKKTVAFIGSGNMAEALINGALSTKALSLKNIVVTDVRADRLAQLEQMYHVKTSLNNVVAASQADIIVLAIKPQQMDVVINELRPVLTDKKIVISIAAGITISMLQKDPTWKVVRVMPNTPALIGEGMSALSCSQTVTPEDRLLAESLFRSVGDIVWVDESQINAITALSGSGPAFVYRLVDHFIMGGIALGLPADIAKRLTIQTFIGATRMISKTGETPDALVQKVASPNGTTMAGLQVFDNSDIRTVVQDTLTAAHRRAEELSGGK